MRPRVGAYVCPLGVYLVECRVGSAEVEVRNVLPAPASLRDVNEAAAHLLHTLATAGIRRAGVALVLRGFDVGHHVLSLPSATPRVLAPVIEREVRRLEPKLVDPAIGWTPLPVGPGQSGARPETQILAAAAPRSVVDAFEGQLRAAGHALLHLTAIPAAAQRLHDEFDESDAPGALVVPLPDGAFIGFFVHQAMRLAVEPHLGSNVPDAVALAEELELGGMFLRQQYGAAVEHVTIAAPASTLPDADAEVARKVPAAVRRLDVQGLGAAELIALGGILDSRAAHPLSLAGLGGTTRVAGTDAVRIASAVAVAIAVMTAGWTVYEAIQARRSAQELAVVRRRVEQESFGTRPLRETALRRKLMHDANAVVRASNGERLGSARVLAALMNAVPGAIVLDSVHLQRGGDGWAVSMAGSAAAESNARAVQALHEFYRDLPTRVAAEGLALERIRYADSSAAPAVGFQVSFVVPPPKE